MLTTPEVTANWREFGFPMLDSAQGKVTIMLHTTPKEDRAWMLNKQHQNSNISDTTEDGEAVHFLITVPCFIINPTLTLPLTLQPTLPYIKFPIGDGKKEVNI